MVDFVKVSPECGDWEAWYMDGKLIEEGHHVCAKNILKAISSKLPNRVTNIEISDEKAEGGFSNDLSDMFV